MVRPRAVGGPARTLETLRSKSFEDFALFLPFADIRARIRAPNRRIVRIVDRANIYRV